MRLHYVHRPEVAEPLPDVPENPAGWATKASGPRSQNVQAALPRMESEPVSTPPAPISRIRQASVTSGDEQPIQRADVFKGYEVEPDRYVVFDQEELKGLILAVPNRLRTADPSPHGADCGLRIRRHAAARTAVESVAPQRLNRESSRAECDVRRGTLA